ncbi:hypothetical protein BGZ76_011358 [Entomortierella beljakovae]|nr:hypothetical protein BGZ76_011358 [Entomortierella beljakovae]
MYDNRQYYESTQNRSTDRAPGLTHSFMSTQSSMDLDSRPMDSFRQKNQNNGHNIDSQLEHQRLYQQQLQQLQQQGGEQQQQHPFPTHPAHAQQQIYQQQQYQQQYEQQYQHAQQNQQYQHPQQNQNQQQYHQQNQQQNQQQYQHQQQHQYQQYNYQPEFNQPSVQYQQQQVQLNNQIYNNQTTQPFSSDSHLMTPSSGRSVETEMPSLAYSEDNSSSQNMHQDQLHSKFPPSPSHSPNKVDSSSSSNDFFITSVLDMIVPSGVPPVEIYDYNQFTDRKWIAKGGNGEIRQAKWAARNTTVILKRLIDVKHSATKLALMFDKEVEVMNRCRQHENIVRFYGVAERQYDDGRNGERFMVMQYYEKGDLVNVIEKLPHTLNDKYYLALDIAIGLDHLYKCGYHHGDLHPKNILIDERRDRVMHQGRYQAKLTDFGLRRIRDNKNNYSSQQLGGVFQFMAPERLEKNRPRYDIRCDIFALGVIYWYIIAGRYPFKNPETYRPGAREDPIDGTPPWYVNTYTKAWAEDPNDRQQNLDEIIQEFRSVLGIQSPSAPYLDPSHAFGQYPNNSYGQDGSNFPSYSPYDSQANYYSGSSGGGSTIRGSPLQTPASMLTPTLGGRLSPLPPSPLFGNSTLSTTSSTRSSRPNPPLYNQSSIPSGHAVNYQRQ